MIDMKILQERNLVCTTCVTFALLLSTATVAQSRHGWRGPDRNGVYPETGLLKTWPAGGPEQAWETLDAGKGYSSPVIADDRLYITGMNEDEDKEILSAYTLDGKKVYETVYGTPWNKSYPETRTTPTIDGNKAYVISGSGEIVCLNTENGNILWKVDGGTAFEHKTGNWGTSECPLVFDNKVIYTPCGDQTTIVALNAETGETVWKSKPLGDAGAYVSPILITHKGRNQIIGSTGVNVFGVNPQTGTIEWTFDEWGEKGKDKISPNTPLYKDGQIFICQGYNTNAVLVELNDDLTAVSVIWRNSDLDTHHGHFVLIDGIIYGSNWINNNQGNWVAVDWNTGETKYENEWGGGKSKGSVVAADGLLYCYDERRGAVALVNPNPEKFDLVSEFRITKGEGPHWAHPVINNGLLYIRHGNALMAYKIK
jgi:outer membrane protein assembly factor BamB